MPRVRVSDDGALLEHNDVQVASIEHKMGINGSATCVMQFGDDGQCVGELVGTVENQGMKQMFRMMNFARIGVGVQGLTLRQRRISVRWNTPKNASKVRAWSILSATAERVAIIEHPNIRRDLLDMKAKVEGMRALAVKLTTHQDRVTAIGSKDDASAAYHQGQVDLLVPLLKSYCSDQAFRVCETAIQVYGGAGFLKDHPVEQACRDSGIFSIYEGTNYIQSMDLVGRKLGQRGGENTKAYFADIQDFLTNNEANADFSEDLVTLGRAMQSMGGLVQQTGRCFS
ncbi:MAG: acyl-CoA dehydrogenase family protein [Polyangiales bacterium]